MLSGRRRALTEAIPRGHQHFFSGTANAGPAQRVAFTCACERVGEFVRHIIALCGGRDEVAFMCVANAAESRQ